MPRSLFLATLVALAACAPEAGPDAATSLMETAAAATAPNPEEAAVVAALQTLFDALETGDAALLRSVADETLVMHYAEDRADGTRGFGNSTVDGLASRITSSDVPLIERMWNPEVRINGAIATVWTEYDFYAGTTFSHCGVDAATMLRSDDGWRVVGLTWTRAQPPECLLHPEGPPAG